MERVLITGGEGFIGKHLQREYDEMGVEYDTVDIYGAPKWRWDITEPFPITMTGYTKIVHLAGLLGTHELFDNVNKAIDVNIKGTVNVLNLAARENASFWGITMAHVWKNPYETTKLAAERLADAWAREYDIDVRYTTVYNAYGEYQAHGKGHPQKIIPTFAMAAIQGRRLPVWGDGSQVVDLIYAGDIAKIIAKGLKHVEGGYGVGRTVNEVAQLVYNLAGREGEVPIHNLPMRKGEHKPTRDPVALRPLFTDLHLEETLKKTIDWYREQG